MILCFKVLPFWQAQQELDIHCIIVNLVLFSYQLTPMKEFERETEGETDRTEREKERESNRQTEQRESYKISKF